MPKKAKELSAVEIRRITKPGLHAVGGVAGLLLQVSGTNGRSWILRTMVGAKRRDIGLGGFPDVPLAVAREKAREVKDQILVGQDPIAVKKAARRAILAEQAKTMTFGEAARQCHSVRSQEFTNEKHKRQWLSSLENYAFPMLEDIAVADVDLPHILKILEPIWMAKTETATRVRQRIEAVLTWAKVSGYRTGDNPARWEGNLKEVLPTPSKIADKKHFPALPWKKVPSFFLELRKQNGTGAKALEFAILTAARSQEIRFATWCEIDIEHRIWTIPGSKMKGKKGLLAVSSG
ncbi:tyrosine-type recombinase/integrase [Geoalkalibacter halelectricus]|uniref:tyrosine-type recombinase/integrase n=1 Tax=Geoalkalibacter halelectricus TaxID=2847045 RepID=UPI003D1EB217